jgi:predicted RNase H-like HicB family nuclease
MAGIWRALKARIISSSMSPGLDWSLCSIPTRKFLLEPCTALSGRLDGVDTKVYMKFFVVLHTDDGERYGATVPDLPGCFSGGDTLELALQNVQEAIDMHVETLIEDGQTIPLSLSLKQHQKNKNFKNGVWAVVHVPIEKYLGPAEKINITVPRVMLARIDEFAKKSGQSRSGFLVEAARHVMHAG